MIEVLVASAIAAMTVAASASIIASTRAARKATEFYFQANVMVHELQAIRCGLIPPTAAMGKVPDLAWSQQEADSWMVYRIASPDRQLTAAFAVP